jgi:hypothetical protein
VESIDAFTFYHPTSARSDFCFNKIPLIRRIQRSLVTMSDVSQFVLPNDQPVVSLDCEEAFNALTNQEKLYAHYLSQAAWAGGLIVFVQVKNLKCSIWRWLNF